MVLAFAVLPATVLLPHYPFGFEWWVMTAVSREGFFAVSISLYHKFILRTCNRNLKVVNRWLIHARLHDEPMGEKRTHRTIDIGER